MLSRPCLPSLVPGYFCLRPGGNLWLTGSTNQGPRHNSSPRLRHGPKPCMAPAAPSSSIGAKRTKNAATLERWFLCMGVSSFRVHPGFRSKKQQYESTSVQPTKRNGNHREEEQGKTNARDKKCQLMLMFRTSVPQLGQWAFP